MSMEGERKKRVGESYRGEKKVKMFAGEATMWEKGVFHQTGKLQWRAMEIL